MRALRRRLLASVRDAAPAAAISAGIIVLVGAALAAITIATAQLVESSAREDALEAAVNRSATFVAVALDPPDYRGGRIRGSGLDSLQEAVLKARGIDGVTIWNRDGRVRHTAGFVLGGETKEAPAPGAYTGQPSGLIAGEEIRTFVPVTGPDTTAVEDVLEIEDRSLTLQSVVSSRRGEVLLIVAALAALLYVAITPPVMRAGSALASRRRQLHARLRRELKRALERDEIGLEFQPKAELASGRVVGVEALARWEHPRRGAQPPLSYVNELEETELIVPFTLHVFEQALRRQQEWASRGLELEVAVNVPGAALAPDGAAEQIVELVNSYPDTAGGLTVEITESAIVDVDISDALTMLRSAGVRLSIDDFGTGQSSLARLGSVPFDELKIDRGFISGLDRKDRTVLVRSMVDLGHQLGMGIVAEGVEWASVVGWLAEIGVDMIQGHVLAPAMRPAELEHWLTDGGERRIGELLAGAQATAGLPG